MLAFPAPVGVFVALATAAPPTVDVAAQPSAADLFRRAEADEARGDFARALEDDVRCAAAAPGSRPGELAAAQAEWLRARSEGDFAPLARLERVRRDPTLSGDPAAVAALAHDAEAFPPGLVRVEARMFVAEAWLRRFDRPADAAVELRRVTQDPRVDPVTARLAEGELVESLSAQGRLSAAAAEARAHADALDPSFVRRVSRSARRRWWRASAALVALVWVVAAAAALLRAGRRGLAATGRAVRRALPLSAGFAVFVGAGGGFLAARYEAGRALPFVLLGCAALPLALVARAWSSVGSATARARVVRAALCGAAALATAFAVLDFVDPAFLEGFGL